MSCYATQHIFTTSSTKVPVGTKCNCGKTIWPNLFRKRPVEVEAYQWFKNGDHPDDDCQITKSTFSGQFFLTEGKVVRYFRHPNKDGETICKHCSVIMHNHGWIDTLEGGHIVCPGDWIVTGITGERYPIKPEIFHATYERLSQ